MEAKKSNIISLGATFSGFTKNEAIQNNIKPPNKRVKVSVYGLKISGINERETTVFKPNTKFAINSAR